MSGDPITGEQLYDELCCAAASRGKSLAGFVAPLFNGNSWKIEQLRIAKAPTQITINRVRALIAGEPLPPHRGGSAGCRFVGDPARFTLTRADAEAMGHPQSGRSVKESRLLSDQLDRKEAIERARRLAEIAHQTRRPGQTLHERVRELAREEEIHP